MTEKHYCIQFTETEVQALGHLLDAGVRHSGLASVHAASALLRKIEAAEPEVEIEAPSEKEPE